MERFICFSSGRKTHISLQLLTFNLGTFKMWRATWAQIARNAIRNVFNFHFSASLSPAACLRETQWGWFSICVSGKTNPLLLLLLFFAFNANRSFSYFWSWDFCFSRKTFPAIWEGARNVRSQATNTPSINHLCWNAISDRFCFILFRSFLSHCRPRVRFHFNAVDLPINS